MFELTEWFCWLFRSCGTWKEIESFTYSKWYIYSSTSKRKYWKENCGIRWSNCDLFKTESIRSNWWLNFVYLLFWTRLINYVIKDFLVLTETGNYNYRLLTNLQNLLMDWSIRHWSVTTVLLTEWHFLFLSFSLSLSSSSSFVG